MKIEYCIFMDVASLRPFEKDTSMLIMQVSVISTTSS